MNVKHVRWSWPILAILILALGSQQSHTHDNAVRDFGSRDDGIIRAPPVEIPVEVLKGMAYGPFREGQSPEMGIYPTLSEMRQDMPLLRQVANGIRTYGCQHLETVVTASREASLPLTLGVWLNGDQKNDRAEIECAVGQAWANPHINSIVVGNESILSGWLTATQVCGYVVEMRYRTGLQVTTAEPWHVWKNNPSLVTCADYLLVHIHPYWECQPIENAVAFVQEKYRQVRAQYPEKAVVIGETGWPTAGNGREGICGPMPTPSPEQQVLFAADFLNWAEGESVDFYYFEAFDESWKCEGGRPGVECRWGIRNTDRTPKAAADLFVFQKLYLPMIMN